MKVLLSTQIKGNFYTMSCSNSLVSLILIFFYNVNSRIVVDPQCSYCTAHILLTNCSKDLHLKCIVIEILAEKYRVRKYILNTIN